MFDHNITLPQNSIFSFSPIIQLRMCAKRLCYAFLSNFLVNLNIYPNSFKSKLLLLRNSLVISTLIGIFNSVYKKLSHLQLHPH